MIIVAEILFVKKIGAILGHSVFETISVLKCVTKTTVILYKCDTVCRNDDTLTIDDLLTDRRGRKETNRMEIFNAVLTLNELCSTREIWEYLDGQTKEK